MRQVEINHGFSSEVNIVTAGFFSDVLSVCDLASTGTWSQCMVFDRSAGLVVAVVAVAICSVD